MGGWVIDIEYIIDGVSHKNSLSKSMSLEGLSVSLVENHGGLKITLNPIKSLEIIKLSAKLDFDFDKEQRIFVNGYQSWTESRERQIDEKMIGIHPIARILIPKFKIDKYGDYTFKKYSRRQGMFHGYTYSYVRKGKQYTIFASTSEDEGFTRWEIDTVNGRIVASRECEGMIIEEACLGLSLVKIEGSEDDVFDQWFEAYGIGKPKVGTTTGWTSWYNYYQNINQDIILNNLKAISDYKVDIFQIDDGYQTHVGDWLSVDLNKFPLGMEYISKEIHNKGMKSGLWLAPFVCERDSKLYKEKPEWLLRDREGKPVSAGSNWSGFYALDIYNGDFVEYLREVFRVVLHDWNYDMVKLDFLYAACLIPRDGKTRGRIMADAMILLREIIGDKLILGCGVPLGSAFGRVDYCRIGADVGLDWDDKFYMKYINRERVSTKQAILNTIFRRQLSGRAFVNDPDVFLLREDNIALKEHEKTALSYINSVMGGLIFTSDNVSLYKDEQKKRYLDVLRMREANALSVERAGDTIIINYELNEKKGTLYFNLGDVGANIIHNDKNYTLKPHEIMLLD